MTILQLDPPLPMQTPSGKGYCHFLIDYGLEEHLIWVVFLDDSGICVAYRNPDIKMQFNPTIGRIRKEGGETVIRWTPEGEAGGVR